MPKLIVKSHGRVKTNKQQNISQEGYVLSNPWTLVTTTKKVKYNTLKLICSHKYLWDLMKWAWRLSDMPCLKLQQ